MAVKKSGKTTKIASPDAPLPKGRGRLRPTSPHARSKYLYNETDRAQVEGFAMTLVPIEVMSKILNISVKAIEKHYAKELMAVHVMDKNVNANLLKMIAKGPQPKVFNGKIVKDDKGNVVYDKLDPVVLGAIKHWNNDLRGKKAPTRNEVTGKDGEPLPTGDSETKTVIVLPDNGR